MITIKFKKGFQAVAKITAALESLDENKEYVCEIKQYRQKRSKNANSYMWELIGQLSQKMNKSTEDLYRNYIKEFGIFRDIELQPEAVGTLKHIWAAYGLGWFSEEVDTVNDKTTLRLYYGSSSYNTYQMSKLINAVVEDCKAVDIETMTPEELAVLQNG